MRQDVALFRSEEANRQEQPSPHWGAAPGQALRVAMNQITTYRWSMLDDVTGYCAAGFPAIGLWRQKLAEFGEERGVDLVLESGLSVSSLSYAGGFTGALGLSFDEAVEDARDAIDLAGAVGAECVVLVSGARALHTARHARRLFVDALRSLGDQAAERNVDLAVLPMHPIYAPDWTFLNTLDDALDTLGRCDHDRVRLAFDAYHLWQEPRLISRIPEIAPLTSIVRLSDWREPTRSNHDRCVPGDGMIPLVDILRAFQRSGWRGFSEIEIWSEELWAGDYLSLLDECRERFTSLWQAAREADTLETDAEEAEAAPIGAAHDTGA